MLSRVILATRVVSKWSCPHQHNHRFPKSDDTQHHLATSSGR